MGESKRDHLFLFCLVLQWNGDYFIGRIDVKIRRVSLSLVMNT